MKLHFNFYTITRDNVSSSCFCLQKLVQVWICLLITSIYGAVQKLLQQDFDHFWLPIYLEVDIFHPKSWQKEAFFDYLPTSSCPIAFERPLWENLRLKMLVVSELTWLGLARVGHFPYQHLYRLISFRANIEMLPLDLELFLLSSDQLGKYLLELISSYYKK